MFMRPTQAVGWLHGNGPVTQEGQNLPSSCKGWWTGPAQNSFVININQNGQRWRNFLPRLQSQKAVCRGFLSAWGRRSPSGLSTAQKKMGSLTTWWRWQQAWAVLSLLCHVGPCAQAARLLWGSADWLCKKSLGSRELRRSDLRTKITLAATRSCFRTPKSRWSPRRRSVGPACSPSALRSLMWTP